MCRHVQETARSLTWEEAVEGATPDSPCDPSEVLLLALLFVHTHSCERVSVWVGYVLQYRRAYAQSSSAATFVAPWRRNGPVTQPLKEAAKRKSDEAMDLLGDVVVRFPGAGRVSRPVARTALNKYLLTCFSSSDKKGKSRANLKLDRAAVPVALLLEETEKSDASSLTTLLISGASRDAGPPRTYAVQLVEMEAELKQS